MSISVLVAVAPLLPPRIQPIWREQILHGDFFPQKSCYLSSLHLSKFYSLFNTYFKASFLLPDLSKLTQLYFLLI